MIRMGVDFIYGVKLNCLIWSFVCLIILVFFLFLVFTCFLLVGRVHSLSTAVDLALALAAALYDTGALELFLAVFGGDQNEHKDGDNDYSTSDYNGCHGARRIAWCCRLVAICPLRFPPGELAAHVLHGAAVLEGKTFEVEERLVFKHGNLELFREVLVLLELFPKSELLVFVILHVEYFNIIISFN